jgi:hypothetical protein
MEEVMSSHRHVAAPPSTTAPMWLAHHPPEHLDRCLVVRGRHVCRRCAVLYPIAVLTAVAVVLLDPPESLMVLALWVLPIPMVLEWVAEHLGGWRYSPTRQVAVTAVGAPALGVALAWHAVEPFVWAATLPVLVWTAICLASAAAGRLVAGVEEPGWQERHDAAEAARRSHLEELLAEADARRDRTG